MSHDVDGFGAPKHTSDRKTFPEGPKEGSTEVRILPPILSQRESGKYVQEHTCHYGYGTKLQGSDKERPNPFYCVEQGKWVSGKFVVTQECPECQAIKLVKAQEERIKSSMKAQNPNVSDAEVAAATESLTKWLRKHNRDFKQYVNVKDAAGRYYTMKLPQKDVWKPIKKTIEDFKQRKMPIDAIAASQGLWFRINRSGKGYKTDYSVEVVTEDVIVNGEVIPDARKPKLGPLTAEDARKAAESCMDIGDVGIRRLSVEQVQRLVASKGDQATVAAIFEGSDPTSQVAGESFDREESPEDIAAGPVTAPAPAVPAASAPVAPVVTAPAAATETKEDVVARARALMEKAKNLPSAAAPAAAPAPAAPPAPAPAPKPAPAPAVSDLVKDPTPPPPPPPPAATSAVEQDFLKQFEM